MVLDPIIDGYHLTHVLMDGGSSLNLIYEDTIRRMGIDPSRISQSNTTFEGVILLGNIASNKNFPTFTKINL